MVKNLGASFLNKQSRARFAVYLYLSLSLSVSLPLACIHLPLIPVFHPLCASLLCVTFAARIYTRSGARAENCNYNLLSSSRPRAVTAAVAAVVPARGFERNIVRSFCVSRRKIFPDANAFSFGEEVDVGVRSLRVASC